MTHAPEAMLAGKKRPFTGAEFLESLRDGREVYIYGERVEGRHDASGVPQRRGSVAQLYDALHDEKTRDVLTAPTDTGSGGYTHKFFKVARSREEVDRPARRDRRLGAHHLRLDGAQPGLQGGIAQHARRQCRVLRQVRRQCARLAQARRRRRCSISTTRSSIRRSTATSRPSRSRTSTSHPEGDRRRHLRLRRQGGGDQLGAHPLQFPRPEHGPGDHRSAPWW